jgi:hypothetical protein
VTAEQLLDLARAGAPLHEQRAALPAPLRPLAHDAILLREEGDGSSRYGGDGPPQPDLTFVAALDLADLPHLDPLPASGTLSFYYDFELGVSKPFDFVAYTKVAYQAGPPQVDGGTPLTGLLMPIIGGDEVPDEHFEFVDELGYKVYDHQLLGLSRDIQGPVLGEIPYWFEQGHAETRERYSAAELQGEGWRLLAQFESSGELMFGDAGAVYYVIPEADLRERRFDRVMGIMQCT